MDATRRETSFSSLNWIEGCFTGHKSFRSYRTGMLEGSLADGDERLGAGRRTLRDSQGAI